MRKYLPSKKFMYIVGAVIVAGLLIFAVKLLIQWQMKANKVAEAEKVALENQKKITYQQFMAIDSDTDGLKDWEEALWKTDPKKADTDDDGTSDGDEAKANRDPLKTNTAVKGKTPSDEIDPAIIADQKKQETDFLKLSMTDQLSRTLLSQYISVKGNQTLSTSDKQDIVDTATTIATQILGVSAKYSISDIKTFNNINPVTLKNYGNKLADGAKNTLAPMKQELSILAKAITDDKGSSLKDLDKNIQLYEIIIQNYLNISAPIEIASLHLDIINNLNVIKDSVEKMKLLFSDTVQAITGISNYKTYGLKLQTDVKKLGEYFASKGVIFLPTDSGYKLFNVVK
jgi:hypothetical protein